MMALLNSCCCGMNSLRKGCFFVALYTMVYYICVICAGALHVNLVMDSKVLLSMSGILVICGISVVFSSILLLIGLCVDNRNMLVPWMITISFTTMVDVAFCIVSLFDQDTIYDFPLWSVLFSDVLFVFLNIYSFLLVASQYQEYLAGRGGADSHDSRRRTSFLIPVPPIIRTQPGGASGWPSQGNTIHEHSTDHDSRNDSSQHDNNVEEEGHSHFTIQDDGKNLLGSDHSGRDGSQRASSSLVNPSEATISIDIEGINSTPTKSKSMSIINTGSHLYPRHQSLGPRASLSESSSHNSYYAPFITPSLLKEFFSSSGSTPLHSSSPISSSPISTNHDSIKCGQFAGALITEYIQQHIDIEDDLDPEQGVNQKSWDNHQGRHRRSVTPSDDTDNDVDTDTESQSSPQTVITKPFVFEPRHEIDRIIQVTETRIHQQGKARFSRSARLVIQRNATNNQQRLVHLCHNAVARI